MEGRWGGEKQSAVTSGSNWRCYYEVKWRECEHFYWHPRVSFLSETALIQLKLKFVLIRNTIVSLGCCFISIHMQTCNSNPLSAAYSSRFLFSFASTVQGKIEIRCIFNFKIQSGCIQIYSNHLVLSYLVFLRTEENEKKTDQSLDLPRSIIRSSPSCALHPPPVPPLLLLCKLDSSLHFKRRWDAISSMQPQYSFSRSGSCSSHSLFTWWSLVYTRLAEQMKTLHRLRSYRNNIDRSSCC